MSVRTTRYLIAAVLALFCIIALLSAANSNGLIGIDTSKAESLSNGVTIPPTPFGGGPTLPQPPVPVSTHVAGAPSTTGNAPQASSYDKNNSIQVTILGAGPNEPAYSEADVRKFIARYTNGFGKVGVESGVAEITDIEFLTIAALQQRMADSLNLQMGEQTLICYVEYSGNFSVYGPPTINGPNAPIPFNHVGQVYDAHTGNPLTLMAFNSK